jgi:hypothetical protein
MLWSVLITKGQLQQVNIRNENQRSITTRCGSVLTIKGQLQHDAISSDNLRSIATRCDQF